MSDGRAAPVPSLPRSPARSFACSLARRRPPSPRPPARPPPAPAQLLPTPGALRGAAALPLCPPEGPPRSPRLERWPRAARTLRPGPGCGGFGWHARRAPRRGGARAPARGDGGSGGGGSERASERARGALGRRGAGGGTSALRPPRDEVSGPPDCGGARPHARPPGAGAGTGLLGPSRAESRGWLWMEPCCAGALWIYFFLGGDWAAEVGISRNQGGLIVSKPFPHVHPAFEPLLCSPAPQAELERTPP